VINFSSPLLFSSTEGQQFSFGDKFLSLLQIFKTKEEHFRRGDFKTTKIEKQEQAFKTFLKFFSALNVLL